MANKNNYYSSLVNQGIIHRTNHERNDLIKTNTTINFISIQFIDSKQKTLSF